MLKKRNYCFELSHEEFNLIISRNCYYCGRIPEQLAYNKTKTDCVIYNGIDRVENEKGYTYVSSMNIPSNQIFIMNHFNIIPTCIISYS